MSYLNLKVLYRNPSHHRTAINDLLQSIVCKAPTVAPERIGTHEPVRDIFRIEDIGRIANTCGGSLLWKRSKGAVTGHVMMGIPKRHSVASITANTADSRAVDMKTFLCSVAQILDVDFGYVHQVCDPEMAYTPRETFAALDQGVTTDDLRVGIPNLAWFTLFGEPYLQLFEAETPIQTDAFTSFRPTPSTYALQITEHASDVKNDFKKFQHLRERVISQLGGDAFWSDDGKTAATRIPQFDL